MLLCNKQSLRKYFLDINIPAEDQTCVTHGVRIVQLGTQTIAEKYQLIESVFDKKDNFLLKSESEEE